MRSVHFDPSQLQGEQMEWWTNWSERAKRARETAEKDVEEGRKPTFNSAIWGELKEWLLKHVFFGKCAYCESPVTSTSFGDAEHYRPKGKVTVRSNGKDTEVSWHGEPHPGYWWLAYDWRNLLPACQRCNSANGKMNQFPVEGQHRGPPPIDLEELDQEEKPLLLHPYRHNPQDHLQFGLKGIVAGITELGRNSILVYDLARDDLRAERQRLQEDALRRFGIALLTSMHTGQPLAQTLDPVLQPLKEGRDPYSMAALHAIALNQAEQNKVLADRLSR